MNTPKPKSLNSYLLDFQSNKDTKIVHTADIILQIGTARIETKTNKVVLTLSDSEHSVPALIDRLDSKLEDFPVNAIVRLKKFAFTAKGYIIAKEIDVLSQAQSLFLAPGKTAGTQPGIHPIVQLISGSTPPASTGKPLATNTNIVNQQQQRSQQAAKQPPQQVAADDMNCDTMTNILRIEDLVVGSNNAIIKAVVRNKSAIKSYNNMNGSGRLMSLELIDDSPNNNEIKATVFGRDKNDPIDRFNEMLQIGQTYLISNFVCKNKAPAYNTLSHPCEISFSSTTKIEPCGQAIQAHTKYSFVPISQLQSPSDPKNAPTVDLIGYVDDIGDITELTTKENKKLKKFSFQICDTSNISIQVTAFAEKAEELSEVLRPGIVIAIRSAKLSSFNSVSVSLNFNSMYEINPEHLAEYHNLQAWMNNRGGTKAVSLSKPQFAGGSVKESISCLISDIYLEAHQQPSFETSTVIYKVVGYFSRPNNTYLTSRHVPPQGGQGGGNVPTWYYDGCKKCQKKVLEEVCTICGEPKEKKYRIQLRLTDDSGAIFVDVIGKTATTFFKMSAEQFDSLDDNDRVKHLFDLFSTPYVVTLKVVPPTGESNNTKYSLVHVEPVNFQTLSNQLNWETEILASLMIQQ